MRSSVVRFRGSFHLKESRLFCPSGILTTEEPSCPQADVTQAPRDAASPASTASCPAVTTIALAPLVEAGYKDYILISGPVKINRNIF
jgi:hypothetical protein